ncbi:MAG: hypothetical protein WC108_00395 [Bacteroidales bacterium]|jgi:hypothetical protein|nr:hypothetical protein [Bacteroidales bacterium]MDD4529123.1 hypothetical protein [Bacteroidales bacterium]MDD4829298.1 hypothetical protein [Bacteroidales bacterium]
MKKNPLISYFTKLSFFSIGVCFLALFSMLLQKSYISINLPYYILLFYLCTGSGYSLAYYLVKTNKMKFENVFMLVKFGKLFLYIIVFLVILMLKIENMIPFTIVYLSLYALYLIFDTITFKNFSKKI